MDRSLHLIISGYLSLNLPVPVSMQSQLLQSIIVISTGYPELDFPSNVTLKNYGYNADN